MDKLKIVSINVRGIRDKQKRCSIINWLKQNHYDIVCLQETYITNDIVKEIEQDFSSFGKIISSCSDSSHSRGVSIALSCKSQGLEVINVNKDTNARKIALNIKDIN